MYSLAIALAVLGALSLLAPNPENYGLRQLEPGRIRIMEPGNEHQARHPASAPWISGFADQFAWPPPGERQWHYKLSIDQSQDAQLALFIPNAGGPLSLFVNGVRTAAGSIQPGVAGPGMGGWMLSSHIGQHSVAFGTGRIDILQASDLPHAGIRAMYLGPRSSVTDATSAFSRWLTGLRMSTWAAALIGVIAVLALLLAAQPWQRAASLCMVTVGATAGLFIPFGQPAWLYAGAAVTVLAGSLLALSSWGRGKGLEALIVAGLAMVAALSALAGLALLETAWLPTNPLTWLHLANSGALPLLTCGGGLIVLWSMQSIQQRLLHARVELATKEQVIAHQQQLLDHSIRNAAILEERQRFARDMHDGIGGHLHGLLMRVRANKITTDAIAFELQHGLNDLRMTVDSLDQLDNDLHAALENFRMRALPQLDAARLALEWRLSDNVHAVSLDARATLNIYRMLQEMLANCIRHAGARQFSVDIDFDESRRILTIATLDDGTGFDPAAIRRGKGLASLQQRVAKSGGQVAVASAPGQGTRIDIRMPVPDRPPSDF